MVLDGVKYIVLKQGEFGNMVRMSQVMTKQHMAAVLYKYGKLYPKVFPNSLEAASELYKQDRIERGVEDNG